MESLIPIPDACKAYAIFLVIFWASSLMVGWMYNREVKRTKKLQKELAQLKQKTDPPTNEGPEYVRGPSLRNIQRKSNQ